jgi:catechol 2,3-dioxygenase-like lactoylglutathione lyase family enzyme
MTLNHVRLGSTRLAAAQAFYARFFGFKVESLHGSSVFMRDREGFLLVLDPLVESHGYPTWFHLGFCLRNASAVVELQTKFEESGHPLARKLLVEPDEFASFFVQDPDGVRIEVSWHAE